MNNEETFLNEIEECLKKNGCMTWREVIPDECKNWTLPYRVDLIFFRDDFGYIGVEAKHTNTLRSGGRIAKAVKQINTKYRNKTYFNGTHINKWSVVVPLKTIWDNCNEETSSKIKQEIIIFLRGFLKTATDISLLEYYPKYEGMDAGISLDAYTKEAIHINEKNKLIKKEYLTEEELEDIKICCLCGYENDIEDVFCNSCGGTIYESTISEKEEDSI